MTATALLAFYRVRLRARIVAELLALVGIAAGVALVFAALVANASLSSTVRALTGGIVGDASVQLVARGPAGMPASLTERVRGLDGVRAASPLVEQRANVAGPDGRASVTLVGGDPSFAELGGPLVRRFAADELAAMRAVALPEGLADRIGAGLFAPVAIETGAGTTRLPLGAALRRAEIGTLSDSPVAIMPLAAAQQVTAMEGRITRLYVLPEAGREQQVRDELERLAGTDANVRDADADADVFAVAAYPTEQSTTMFAVLAAVVGFLFAACAVLLTADQRRALVTMLRRDGFERRAIVTIMLLDALVLGVAGTAVGLLAGDQLSRHLFTEPPGYLATGFPVGTSRIVPLSAVATAAAGGIAVAVAAVLLPTLDLIGAARRGAARSRRGPAPTAAGGVLVAAAIAIALLRPSWALAGLIGLAAGLLLLLPVLLDVAARGFGALAEHARSGSATFAAWALRGARANPVTLALASTGAIAVFALVAIGGARADLIRGLDGSARAVDDNADVWVTLRGGTSAFAVAPLRLGAAELDELRALPGVAQVGLYRGSWLDVGDRRAWVQAPPADAPAPVPADQLLDGDAAAATAALRAGGAVVLSRGIADALGAGVGDEVTLPTPRPQPLRVAAISNNLGWPSGAIVLNADDYARAWDDRSPSALQLRLESDADPAAVAAAVRRTLGDGLAARVETYAQRLAAHREAAEQGLVRLTQISALVIAAAVLSMAAAMTGVIWQRRPALQRLQLDGLTPGQLWRALLLEAGVLLGTGCLAGAVSGLLGQRLLTGALETITGFPTSYRPAGLTTLLIVAGVLAVALAVIAIPGRIATRARTPAAAG